MVEEVLRTEEAVLGGGGGGIRNKLDGLDRLYDLDEQTCRYQISQTDLPDAVDVKHD